MKKLFIFLIALLLPFFALEMSADEEKAIITIPIELGPEKNLTRSQGEEHWWSNPYEGDDPIEEISKVALQVVLKVDPYNGAPESYIIKTFYADSYTWSKQYIR